MINNLTLKKRELKSHEIDEPFRLGMYQAKRYFGFLCTPDTIEDVEQCVRLAVLEANPLTTSKREFNNAVNRELYKLARARGYRKANVNDADYNTANPAYQRMTYQFSEIDNMKGIRTSNDKKEIV